MIYEWYHLCGFYGVMDSCDLCFDNVMNDEGEGIAGYNRSFPEVNVSLIDDG
jgi:hypothetical protein